jgi:hypothetical protein
MKRLTVYILIILLGCFSCKRSEQHKEESSPSSGIIFKNGPNVISSDDMLSYTIQPENGLLKTKKINEYTYSVKYKSIPYIIAQESGGKTISRADYKNKISELEGLQYFDLRLQVENTNNEILKYDLGSEEQYDERINYLAFKMQNDIQLIDGKDTLECLLYHMERAYDIVPYSTILCAFKKIAKPVEGDKIFVLHDNLFNNGTIKLTFLNSDIQNAPELKL